MFSPTSVHYLLLAVVIASSGAIAAAPPVSVDTRVKIALTSGAEFHIRITVDPHPANREVCLRADLNGFPDVKKSCWSVHGEKSPRTTWKWLKDMDTGDWQVYATVERNDGRTLRSLPMRLTVRGPGYEEPPDLFGEP